MISVACKSHEVPTVIEFFELFKTPWEPYRPDHHCDVLIATVPNVPVDTKAKLIIIYGAACTDFDTESGRFEKSETAGCRWLRGDGFELPIYGEVAVFNRGAGAFMELKNDGDPVLAQLGDNDRHIVRIGYDLFEEVGSLLSKGQPPANAAIPTLEIHIAVLRECIRIANVSFVEILPVPYGCDFAVCLTHDVDFVGIRDHKFDHTMWGFVYRASIGALVSAFKGRSTWRRCIENWRALASLPLVHLGVCKDFWIEFERYCEIERGLNPTYFFIPFRDEPGTWNGRPAPSRRAARYDVREVGQWVRTLAKDGCEVGLHGLNAWRDSDSALRERARLTEVVEQSQVGVRMHWLYTDQGSSKVLQDAGFAYDSTCGYNDAIGFRAGTAQGFCPPNAPGLLELPLVIQDTAMLYPNRMNLSEGEAMKRCNELIQSMIKYGGTLTVNWHTRSLSPERLWGEFYKELLTCIKRSQVWFCNCRTNAGWFRARRAVRFEEVPDDQEVRLVMESPLPAPLPPLTVRVHGNRKADPLFHTHNSDIPWRGETELPVRVAPEARI